MGIVNVNGVAYNAGKLWPGLRRELFSTKPKSYTVTHYDVTVYCWGEFPLPTDLSFAEGVKYLYPLVSAAQKPVHEILAQNGVYRRNFNMDIMENSLHACLTPQTLGALSQSPFVRNIFWEKFVRVRYNKLPLAALN